jgi:hypothetical protein
LRPTDDADIIVEDERIRIGPPLAVIISQDPT